MNQLLVLLLVFALKPTEGFGAEEVYVHCVSSQWQVRVFREDFESTDSWRMETHHNTIMGWELKENSSALMESVDPEWMPSPTAFRTSAYELVVQIQTYPMEGPERMGQFFDRESEYWHELSCKLPWLE